MASPSNVLLDPTIFASLKDSIEEESSVREVLTAVVTKLERAVGVASGLLSRVHSTPRVSELVKQVEEAVGDEAVIVAELSELASKHPYYKYNQKWHRTVQNAIFTTIYCAWLGGFSASFPERPSSEVGSLLTLEQVGTIFKVPTNLQDRDAFHITIEEYLLALTDLTQDLARLAPNAVTLGDVDLPPLIGGFVRDVLAGFQLLNLKNDILRKRADAVKYDVKRVEDVVYDLSLRGLLAGKGADAVGAGGDEEMKGQ